MAQSVNVIVKLSLIVVMVFFVWGLVLNTQLIFNRDDASKLSNGDFDKMKVFIVLSWISLVFPIIMGVKGANC